MLLSPPQPRRRLNTGARVRVPSWLANPDLPAPCICGGDLLPGQPHIMAEGELGMKRWFHLSCWNLMFNDEEMDDDIDEDEWYDED